MSTHTPEPFIDTYSRRFITERYAFHAHETLPSQPPAGNRGDPVWHLHEKQSFLRSLIDETVAPVRIEPENPYVVHASVPSVRNLMANQLILVGAGSAWRYCSSTTAWHETNDPRPDRAPDDRAFLLIQSDFLVLGPVYGEFAVSLALLDAGHLVQGIREVASELGYDTSVTYFPGTCPEKRFRHALLVEIDLTPMWISGAPLMASRNSPCPVAHAVLGSEVMEHWNPGPELRILVDSICSDGSRQAAQPPAGTPLGRHLARQARRSAHSSQGLTFIRGPVPETLLSDLVQTARWWAGDETVKVVLLVRDGLGYSVLDLDSHGASPRGMWSRAGSDLLRHPGESIALEDMVFAALVMADTGSLRSRGAADVASSIMRAGEVAQALSVTAAGAGLIARPLKDIDECRVMKEIRTEDVPLHMVVAGYPATMGLTVDGTRRF